MREELGGMRKEVEGEKQDLLASLAELTRYLGGEIQMFLVLLSIHPPDLCLLLTCPSRRMVDSLSCLEAEEGELEVARRSGEEREREVVVVRQQLELELARLGDCHREIEGYSGQLEEALRWAHHNIQSGYRL